MAKSVESFDSFYSFEFKAEIARKLKHDALTHLILLCLFLVFSTVGHQEPLSSVFYSGLLGAVHGLRWYLSFTAQKNDKWYFKIRVLQFLSATGWGLFCAHMFWSYPEASVQPLFLLMIVAAGVASQSRSLCQNRVESGLLLAIPFGLPALILVMQGTFQSFGVVLFLIAATVISILQARNQLQRFTELKKCEFDIAQLRADYNKENSFLFGVLDGLDDMVTLKDFEGKYQMANRSMVKILGKSEAEIIGKTAFDLFPKDLADIITTDDASALREGKSTVEELLVPTATGDSLWMQKSTLPYRNKEGVVVGVITITRNVTNQKTAQISLRRAHEKLQKAVQERTLDFTTLAESLPHLIWSVSADGKTYYSNSHWEKYTGTPFQGVNIWNSAVHPDDLGAAYRKWLESFNAGVSYSAEYRMRRFDGVYRWHIVRAVPVKDASGEIMKWFGTCTDVQDQKESHLLLVESKARLDAIISNASIILWSIDKDGVYNFAEGRALDKLPDRGTRRAGRSIFDVYRDYPVVKNAARKALDGQVTKILFPISDVWFETLVTPLFNEAQEVIGAVGASFDVTERMQADASLKVTQERLNTVMNHSPLVLWSVDQRGVFTTADGLGLKILKLTADQVVGRHYKEACGNRAELKRVIERALTGETFNTEIEINGSYFDTHFSALSTDKNEFSGFVALSSDITSRRLTEIEKSEAVAREAIALEASAAKSQFLANMSHEIRTPLNGIIGMTDLLIDTDLNEQQRQYARIVQMSGTNLLTIINDILDFSKIEAGKLQIENIDFNLVAVIEGQADLLLARAREKGISLMTFVDPSISAHLVGDPGRISQILLNLVSNAIKFTEKGSVTVRAMKTAETSEERELIAFSIEDTGIGISSQSQANLFQAFTQADGSTARKYGGTGLGLSICKKLVEMLGGSIGVTSIIGEGSKFLFTLPFAKPTAGLGADSGSTESLPNVELLNLCILLVGGDKGVSGIFLEYLKHWGFHCTLADGRDAGLEVLRRSVSNGSPFDLVIVDQMADRFNALQFAKLVRANPQIQRSKMMLVCEGDGSQLTQEMSDAGFASVLGKPVKQSDFYDTIIRTIYGGPKVIAAHQLAVAMQAKPTTHQQKRVLVAEDNSVNQLLVLTMLKKLGYQAQAVSNGREAVAAVAQGSYDLILMDCQMPEMDGFQATGEIKKWCAQFSIHIPIVALTANAMKDDQDRCIASGMDDYLSKPIKLDRLSAMLERHLRKLAA